MRNFKGFTLAEVLVTLGIIGVVSAMTMPTLIQNHQRKSQVVQLHKVYNELSQGLLRYQNDKNAVSLREAGLTSQAEMITFLRQYFKVVQSCENRATPCMATSYRKLSGDNGFSGANSSNCFAIASGAVMCPRMDNTNGMYFIVDTNGAKGPNIQGRDLFTMFVYSDGTIDDKPANTGVTGPLSSAQRETNYTSGCRGANGGDLYGCFGKILNDGWEMTY